MVRHVREAAAEYDESGASMRKHTCPCKKCRPPGMTLKQAMRRCRELAEIERYGVEGARKREDEKRARLSALRKAKNGN
jgi:hypothetical protein